MVLLSGALPNPKLQTSVLSIWLVNFFSYGLKDYVAVYYVLNIIFCFPIGIHHFPALFVVDDQITFLILIPSVNVSGMFWMIPFGFSAAGRLVFHAELYCLYSIIRIQNRYKKNVHTTITINDIVVTCTFYAIIDPNNESFITCFHTTVQESQMS